VVLLAILASGCGRSPVEQVGAEVTLVPQISEEVRGKLLEGAITILDRLETYDEDLAVNQVFDRLNQWIHADPVGDAIASSDWKPDGLFRVLPEDYSRNCATDEELASSVFDPADLTYVAIRDQRWLADIAENGKGRVA